MVKLVALRKILKDSGVIQSDSILLKNLSDRAKPLFDKFQKEIDLKFPKFKQQVQTIEENEDSTLEASPNKIQEDKMKYDKNSSTVTLKFYKFNFPLDKLDKNTTCSCNFYIYFKRQAQK
jgi:hypothetical protein